jgi:hypothetical protein
MHLVRRLARRNAWKFPLALEQRNGMTVDRFAEIYGYYERPASEERD